MGISALSAIFSPFSSVPFLPFVIAVWGNILTASILLLGWLLGGIISYFLGCLTGYSLIEKIFSPKKVEYYKQELSIKINFLIVLMFRLAMPTEVAGYVLGTIKYKFSKYLIVTALAEIPFAIISVYSADAFIKANKSVFIIFIILALITVGGASYIFKRIRKSNSQKI